MYVMCRRTYNDKCFFRVEIWNSISNIEIFDQLNCNLQVKFGSQFIIMTSDMNDQMVNTGSVPNELRRHPDKFEYYFKLLSSRGPVGLRLCCPIVFILVGMVKMHVLLPRLDKKLKEYAIYKTGHTEDNMRTQRQEMS